MSSTIVGEFSFASSSVMVITVVSIPEFFLLRKIAQTIHPIIIKEQTINKTKTIGLIPTSPVGGLDIIYIKYLLQTMIKF
jgi:hypothetical protein